MRYMWIMEGCVCDLGIDVEEQKENSGILICSSPRICIVDSSFDAHPCCLSPGGFLLEGQAGAQSWSLVFF